MVHCLGERALLFFLHLWSFFWRFLPSNEPIMLYNICYWWFFFFKVIDEHNTLCIQNTEAKSLPADICIFSCFGGLSPATVHSTDCRFDSRVKRWIPVLIIVTYLHKNFFLHWNKCKQSSKSLMCCFWSTVSKHAPTLNTAFSLINVHAKWWIHCFLISSTPLLSHVTSISDWPKWVCGVFLVFSGTTARFGRPEHSASFLSVRPCLKSIYTTS